MAAAQRTSGTKSGAGYLETLRRDFRSQASALGIGHPELIHQVTLDSGAFIESPDTIHGLTTDVEIRPESLRLSSRGQHDKIRPYPAGEPTVTPANPRPLLDRPLFNISSQKEAYTSLLKWRPWGVLGHRQPKQATSPDHAPPSVAELVNLVDWSRCQTTDSPALLLAPTDKAPLDMTLHRLIALLAFYQSTGELSAMLVDSAVLLYIILSYRTSALPHSSSATFTLNTDLATIERIYSLTVNLFPSFNLRCDTNPLTTAELRFMCGSASDGHSSRSSLMAVPGYMQDLLANLRSAGYTDDVSDYCDELTRFDNDWETNERLLRMIYNHKVFTRRGASYYSAPPPRRPVAVLLYEYIRANRDCFGDDYDHYLTDAATGVPYGAFLLLCAATPDCNPTELTLLGRPELELIFKRLKDLIAHYSPYDRMLLGSMLPPSNPPVVLSDSGSLYVSSPLLCCSILAAAMVPVAAYFAISIIYSSSSKLGNLSSVFLLLSGAILGTGPAYVRRGWQYYDFLRLRLPASVTSDADSCLALFLLQHRDPGVSTVRGSNACYLPDYLRSPGGNIESDVPVRITDLLQSHARVEIYTDAFRRYILYCEGGYAVLSPGENHLVDSDRPTRLTLLDAGRLDHFVGYIRNATIGSGGSRRLGPRTDGQPRRGLEEPAELIAKLFHPRTASTLGHLRHSGKARTPDLRRVTTLGVPIRLRTGYDGTHINHLRQLPVGRYIPVGHYRGVSYKTILSPVVDADYVNYAYSTLSMHDRDYFLDLLGNPLSTSRFAAIVRAAVEALEAYPQHVLYAISRRCKPTKQSNENSRLTIPVYRDDTRRSVARIRMIVAGGPPPIFYRPTALGKNALSSFKAACSTIGAGGPTLLGHVFSHLAGCGCSRVHPYVLYLLDNSPCLAAYGGLWQVSGRAPSNINDLLHYLSLEGVDKISAVKLLTMSLYRATVADLGCGCVPLLPHQGGETYATFNLDTKMYTRLMGRVCDSATVPRAIYYASLSPSKYALALNHNVRCTVDDANSRAAPYTPLEQAAIPQLTLKFNIVINGGLCHQSLREVVAGPVVRTPQRYAYQCREVPTVSVKKTPPCHPAKVPVHLAPVGRVPAHNLEVRHPPPSYVPFFFPYTRYRLLIYPPWHGTQATWITLISYPVLLYGP